MSSDAERLTEQVADMLRQLPRPLPDTIGQVLWQKFGWMDRYDAISVLDYRYWDEEVRRYLSAKAYTRYLCETEAALARVLSRLGHVPESVAKEIEAACKEVFPLEVDEEEGVWPRGDGNVAKPTRHDIVALVNCISRRVSDEAKPWVHKTATSYDIIDTANAARYQDCKEQVVIPVLERLLEVLARLARDNADQPQMGRTHGQHAIPVTFGFAMAEYVSRLGQSLHVLRDLKLYGKFSGAVGAYNASAALVEDPVAFEALVLDELGLQAAEISTQIVPPDPLVRLMSELVIAGGIIADLADSMRHLQRSEIGEVGEEFEEGQAGSSYMPQKQNPINFENAKSMWKILVGRVMTVYLDLTSEHQRDLTGSASGRTVGEMMAFIVAMTKRITRTVSKLQVNPAAMERNMLLKSDLTQAGPLRDVLAELGHPDAHATVVRLSLKAQERGWTLLNTFLEEGELESYIERMTPEQFQRLKNPDTGLAPLKARQVAERYA